MYVPRFLIVWFVSLSVMSLSNVHHRQLSGSCTISTQRYIDVWSDIRNAAGYMEQFTVSACLLNSVTLPSRYPVSTKKSSGRISSCISGRSTFAYLTTIFLVSVGSCESGAWYPGRGRPSVGGQDVLLVPGPGQPLPHHGVPTWRSVLVLPS